MNKYKKFSEAAQEARKIEKLCLAKKMFKTIIEATKFNNEHKLNQEVYFCTLCFKYHLSARVQRFINKRIKKNKVKIKAIKPKKVKVKKAKPIKVIHKQNKKKSIDYLMRYGSNIPVSKHYAEMIRLGVITPKQP